jgi:Ca2+-binding EF-hand superfamily protein
MKSFASKLIPVTVASILCGVAVAGGGKDDKMKMMDSNGDGKITSMEHADGAKMMFTKMDSDKDGQVTAAEMDSMHASKHGSTKADKEGYDKQGHDKAMTDRSHDKAGKMSSTAKIAAMDTNSDGKLSAAEHASGAKQMFSKMDADRDGQLTAQEMREGERSMMSASDQ